MQQSPLILKPQNFATPLVRRFIQKLKKNRDFKPNNEQLELLNDKSVVIDPKNETPNFPMNYLEITSKIISKLGVLHPYDNIKILLDILHFLLIIFYIYWMPFEICFNVKLNDGVYGMMLMFFACDILLNFNTVTFSSTFLCNFFLRHIFTMASS